MQVDGDARTLEQVLGLRPRGGHLGLGDHAGAQDTVNRGTLLVTDQGLRRGDEVVRHADSFTIIQSVAGLFIFVAVLGVAEGVLTGLLEREA